ncbi:MAG: prenyltransferase/squalene oxidase repeat-containing protein [Candidatus Gottesmanbacteria bacterium]
MKKTVLLIAILFFLTVRIALADAVIDNGLNFLKSKQDATGKITNGFSSPSQWSAIAFMANNINPADVKISTNSSSLRDFLLNDKPGDNSSATDWESRILAIVAIGDDPTNFNGVNYVQKLESFYNNQQIGDITSLNEDFFGLLALISCGVSSDLQVKKDTLNFIITHQASDGGFSWSPDTTCAYCGTTIDMTAAAIQSLQAAKDNDLTNDGLDNAILLARDYLLVHQNADGGFPGWSGTSDSDTTSWGLMALNVLGLGNSDQAINARNWLITNQQTDGGFLTWSGEDTTTTAQSIIALLGKSWILNIFTPSASPSPTPSVEPSPSPTPTPTPTPSPTSTPSPSPSPTPTPTPSADPSPSPSSSSTPTSSSVPSPSPQIIYTYPSPTPQVLGEATVSSQTKEKNQVEENQKSNSKKIWLIIPGGILILIALKFWLAKGT